jgi:hypothetical protein
MFPLHLPAAMYDWPYRAIWQCAPDPRRGFWHGFDGRIILPPRTKSARVSHLAECGTNLGLQDGDVEDNSHRPRRPPKHQRRLKLDGAG